MKRLTRDALLNWDGFKTVDVELPRLEGVITVRELSQAEREAMAIRLASADGSVDMANVEGLQAQLVCWATVDEDGKRLFKQSEVKTINQSWPPEDLQSAGSAIIKLSGLSGAEAGEVPN